MAKKFDTSALKKDLDKKSLPGTESITNDLLKNVFDESRINILEEFKELIPRLSDEEFKLLEDNILEEGCRDAIVLWQQDDKYYIIDGHNRYRICKQHGINFKTTLLELANRQEVVDWMVRNQLGKRNITEETKSYLRGLQYRREKGRQGGDKRSQTATSTSTSERLAQEHKVSEKTIKRDEQFADAIDIIAKQAGVDIKNKLLNREIGGTKQQIITIAQLEPKQQESLLSKLRTGEINSLSKLLKSEKPKNEETSKAKSLIYKSSVYYTTRVADAEALMKVIVSLVKQKKSGVVSLTNECDIQFIYSEDNSTVSLTIEATPEDLFKIGLALAPYLS